MVLLGSLVYAEEEGKVSSNLKFQTREEVLQKMKDPLKKEIDSLLNKGVPGLKEIEKNYKKYAYSSYLVIKLSTIDNPLAKDILLKISLDTTLHAVARRLALLYLSKSKIKLKENEIILLLKEFLKGKFEPKEKEFENAFEMYQFYEEQDILARHALDIVRGSISNVKTRKPLELIKKVVEYYINNKKKFPPVWGIIKDYPLLSSKEKIDFYIEMYKRCKDREIRFKGTPNEYFPSKGDDFFLSFYNMDKLAIEYLYKNREIFRDDEDLYEAIILLKAKIGDSTLVDSLLEIGINSSDPGIRYRAVIILENYFEDWMLPYFEKFLKDPFYIETDIKGGPEYEWVSQVYPIRSTAAGILRKKGYEIIREKNNYKILGKKEEKR